MTAARIDAGIDALARLGPASRGEATAYLSAARRALERMVGSPRLLDPASLERRTGGYARTLLFGDDDVSVWAIAWDAGARTPVHDHHCSCCFAVLAGELHEVGFRAAGDATALALAERRLGAGAVRCMMPSGPNLHQLVNRGGSEAISVHVYGFDHRVRASSVRREYRPLPR